MSIILVTVLIINLGDKSISSSYNKTILTIFDKNLAFNTSSMIILTVTGDKRYINIYLEKLFKDNEILHLLVLSGGNIAILTHFLEYNKIRNSKSYFVFKYSLLVEYFVFSSLQHPVARALIFMLIDDITYFLGFRPNKFKKIGIFLFLTIFSLYILNFSISFFLSAYFSLLIVVYNILTLKFNLNSRIRNTVFPLYMTIFSFFITNWIFHSTSFFASLRSNYLVLPLFEYFSLLIYFVFFISPVLTLFPNLLVLFLSIINFIFRLLFLYLESLRMFS